MMDKKEIIAQIGALLESHATTGRINAETALKLADRISPENVTEDEDSKYADIDVIKGLALLEFHLLYDLRGVLNDARDKARVDELLAVNKVLRKYV